jgi:hypothetical protein
VRGDVEHRVVSVCVCTCYYGVLVHVMRFVDVVLVIGIIIRVLSIGLVV